MKVKDIGKVATTTQFDNKGDSGVLTSKSHLISTLDQLIAHCKIDLENWTVDHYIANSWQVGARIDGVILVQPLFQIKAWLNRNTKNVASKGVVQSYIEDAKKHAPKYAKISREKVKGDKHSLFVSLPDAHIGKLAWSKETGGADYDIAIASKVFIDAIKALVARSAGFQYDEIIFPVGNDFLQSDNSESETTSGTRVDTDGRWQKALTEARKILVEAIDYLSGIAPVKVVVVSGNHDMQSMFGLGEVLSAWYRNSKDVTVDNAPTPRKYHEYGDCLVMWTHGNQEKADNLPLIMATENPTAWGRTVYREVHTGHFHTKRSVRFRDVDEKNGVRVRVIPSLSPPDSWHNQHGYWNVRAAEAYVYHRRDGCVASFSFNLGVK